MNYKKHIPWAITLIIVFLVIKSINNYTFIASIISDFLSTIMPFIVGVILAYALNPIMRFFETKYKLSRAISILLTFILVAILISTCLLFIIPVLLENIVELGSQIPVYIQQVETFLYENLDKIDKLTNTDVTTFVSSQLETLIPTILEIGKNIFSQILTTTISLTNMVVNFVVSIVICIYTLIDKENFIRYFKKINRIILKDKESITINFIKTCNDIIGKYIIAKSLDSLFIGIVATIFLVLIGANYAVLSGVLIGITNMIPFFGPFIGGIPTVLINLFCGPKMAIIVAIFVIILQQIDGNIISPKFVGSRVGINPFLTLFSVTLGGHYFGVLGMILAMPFTGVLKIYLDKLLYLYETKYIIKT